ncbi:unnamed protein product, partial [Ectocarpus fasciculatus]
GRNARHPLDANTDTISQVLSYCAENEYVFLAGVSSNWRSTWEAAGRPKRTSVSLATATNARVETIMGQPSFHAATGHLGGVFCLAARAGNLGGIQTAARESGDGWKSLGPAVMMTAEAASAGHKHILVWAKSSGCRISVHVMRSAIKGGHLDVVRWARHETGAPWDADACRLAALGGHLHVLRFLREEGRPWDEQTCVAAVEGGHLECLQWLRREGCPWDSSTCSSAAWGNRMQVLKWARENGCPWDVTVSHGAALAGNLPMLMWARENRCPLDRRTCSYAALGGHLECLRWLRREGCPWDEDTAACAAQGGFLEVLRWAVGEGGCPWNQRTCARIAATRKRNEVAEWIQGLPVLILPQP